jgi:hypothetical protein
MDAAKILKIDALTRLPNRYRELHEYLAGVLEGERDLVTETESPEINAFQLRSDVETVAKARLSAAGHAKRVESLFAHFAPFFDGGVLIARDPSGRSEVRAMFMMGRCFSSSARESQLIDVTLPEFAPDRVMKGRTKPFLQALHLDSVGVLADTSVFALTPRRDTVIVFLCGRPHPWQIGVLERTHGIVTELLRAGASR